MENGFSSPRSGPFPTGLRVLVVDDDPTCLRILEKMLKRCSYEVTKCCLARDALNILRERKDGFDIVISDVNMPDMDGFKLLEHVGLEMDLPVIMMSVDGETSRVMKGVQHGACDYLLKPVRLKELKNIWQHVLRKKIHEVKDIESLGCRGEIQNQRTRNGSNDFDGGRLLLNVGELGAVKKRKDTENQRQDDQELVDPSSSKKARVVWSVDLHQKFVNAVNQIGLDKAGPKKILDLMNVPWLTRENVASHLQKYRLFLSKLEKENELSSSGGIMQKDCSSRDPPGSFGLQNSIAMHQKNAASNNSGDMKNKFFVDDMGPKIHAVDIYAISPCLPVTEFNGDFSDCQTVGISSQLGLSHSFKLKDQYFKYQLLETTTPTQQGNQASVMEYEEPPSQKLELFPVLEDEYSQLLVSGQQHDIQVDLQYSVSSIDPRISIPERDKPSPVKIPPQCTQARSDGGRILSPIGHAINSVPCEADCHSRNPETRKVVSTVTPCMKNETVDQHGMNNWEPLQQKLFVGGEPALASSLEENLQLSLLQEYGCTENIGLQNLQLLDYYDLELIAERESHFYEELGFNCDKFHDTMEIPFVEQGLFIA